MNTPLDTFETELLAELRAVVARRSQARIRTTSRPGYARRVALALGAAGVIALVALIGPMLRPVPAYAVSQTRSGIVHLEINRLEEAPTLQAELAAHGINSDITYLGHEMTCAEGRYDSFAASAPGSATAISVGAGIDVTLDLRDVADGQTLVIAASTIRSQGIHAQVALVDGPVGPCQALPIPGEDLP